MRATVADALLRREQYKTRSHVRTKQDLTAFDEGVETGLYVAGLSGAANEYQEAVERLEDK